MVMLWYSSAGTPNWCLYLAGVSRYPVVDASVVVDPLGSENDGSQPLFLDKGAGEGDGDGGGRGRVIFCLTVRLLFISES